MFAFALWDTAAHTLYLTRDRLGEKPLYYGWIGPTLLFASELKAMRACPWWSSEIDRGALALYLRHSYVPAPYSIYRGVRKVMPGTILAFRPGVGPAAPPEESRYWSARGVVETGLASRVQGSVADIVEALDALLRGVVRREMIADVPLGAFLSGGIDSSTIVALMQAQSSRPVRTFTIGFHESGYDEAQCAKQVAAHLGTDHTEFYVEPRHALDVIPHLAAWFDDPFADSSQIPTYLVSELTRKHVTVALSGDGGDELFAGYNRYFWASRIARARQLLPPPVRSASTAMLRSLSAGSWNRILGFVPSGWLPGRQAAQHRKPSR